jgi:hypothetical protein
MLSLLHLAFCQSDIYIGFENKSDTLKFSEMVNYNYVSSKECSGHGTSSLMLGPIKGKVSSSIKALVCSGPGTIDFKWSKQSTSSNLDFFVDGQKVGFCDDSRTDKMQPWGPYPLDSNKHELVWSYRFGNPTDSDIVSSKAFIDDIHMMGLQICGEKSLGPSIGPNDNFEEIYSKLNNSINITYITQGSNLQMVFDAAKAVEKNQLYFAKTFILNGDYFEGNLTIRVNNICIMPETKTILNQEKVKLDGKWHRFNILLENTTNVSIIGLDLVNNLCSIQLENCVGCKIQGNDIMVSNNVQECPVGLLLYNSSQCEITNNFIINDENRACLSSKAIWLISSTKTIIKGNNINGFKNNIFLTNNSCNNEIYGCLDDTCINNSFEESKCNNWWPYE